jgi:hypothetical protein
MTSGMKLHDIRLAQDKHRARLASITLISVCRTDGNYCSSCFASGPAHETFEKDQNNGKTVQKRNLSAYLQARDVCVAVQPIYDSKICHGQAIDERCCRSMRTALTYTR